MNEHILGSLTQTVVSTFTSYVSPIFAVDGAESVVIQTTLSAATSGTTHAKYKVQGSLDGVNFGNITDANGTDIEVTLKERYRIVTIRNSNVKAIRLAGSANSTQSGLALNTIHIRYK